MRALLDVNVLIALLDADHLHHSKATEWLAANLDSGWASCPLTENGCIRIMSQPSYPNAAAPAVIAGLLRDATQAGHHVFWPDDLSALEPGKLDWAAVVGSRQLADAYLLALSVGHRGRFVTLDRRVSRAAVPKARPNELVTLD